MLGVLLYIFAGSQGIQVEKSDELFPLIATGNYFPAVVGILFIIGLISSAYSAAGSALTALTTSFTVDILGTRGRTEEEIVKIRKRVHIGMAVIMGITIFVFNLLNNTSVIDAVYILASYTYGPILGLFAFGIFMKQQVRDKYLQTQSQSSLANKTGQYYQLIREQQAVAQKKNHIDSIVGRTVADFLELSISEEGKYYDNSECKVLPNSRYGLVTFVDLGPQVQVSSRNNILLTRVQGRDYTRKEYISGGDLEITINGKITSKYPDVYPEAEVSKFIRLVQYKGVIDCDNTVLRQFNISRLIIQGYTLQPTDCRNVQPYSLNCVAVEPSEAVELKLAEQEKVDTAIKHTNKWIKYVKFGTEVIDPASLLKLTRLWV